MPEPAAPLLDQEAQAVIAEALTAHPQPAYYARKITAALEPLVATLVAEQRKAEQERCAVIVDTLMRREAAKHYVEHPDIYEQDLKLYVLSDVARAIRGAS